MSDLERAKEELRITKNNLIESYTNYVNADYEYYISDRNSYEPARKKLVEASKIYNHDKDMFKVYANKLIMVI